MKNKTLKVGDIVQVKMAAAREVGHPKYARLTGRITSINSDGTIDVDGELGDTWRSYLTAAELKLAK